MCPLRIILIFLSATLAGYFAWKTVRSDETNPVDADDNETSKMEGVAQKNKGLGFRKVIGKGFWTFVDMASGRYLWRNLVEAKERSHMHFGSGEDMDA